MQNLYQKQVSNKSVFLVYYYFQTLQIKNINERDKSMHANKILKDENPRKI